jgi:hypothetical protein
VARFIGFEGARRFADYIEKLTGDQEIVPPGVIVEIDPPEAQYLKRVRPWSSIASIAASVGNVGRMQLTNPAAVSPNPGNIVVVQGAGIINKAATGRITISGDAAAAGGGVSPANGFDTRIPLDNTNVLAVQPPQNTISNANAVISGYILERFWVVVAGDNGYSRILPVRPFIMTPGHNLTIFDETTNEVGLFIAWGYTRPARAEELAL